MKRFFFTLAFILISFLIVEIFLGYLLWVKKSNVLSTTYYVISKIHSRLYPRQNTNNKIDISAPQSIYIPDDYLGWSNRPGKYTVVLKNEATGKYHSFTNTVNENGNRITSFTPEFFEGKKEIWIFGDSFTFGFGNNDETTFPFFLQQYLPNFRIVNYAGNGYGNVHEYLQIKREFEKKKTLPEVIIVVYGYYLLDRNIAAPSRLELYKNNSHRFVSDPSIQLALYRHPRASINNGKLEIEYVALFPEFNKATNAKDPSIDYQFEITKKILGEIYYIGKKNGVKLILAFISGEDSDEVVAYSRQLGYIISDIRPKKERKEWDNFGVFDTHPGPLAQNNYAIKLHKTISKVISN